MPDDDCSSVSKDEFDNSDLVAEFTDFLDGVGPIPSGLDRVVGVLRSDGVPDIENRHAVVARMADALTSISKQPQQGVPMIGRFSRRTIVMAAGGVFALGGVAAAAGGGGVIADVFTGGNDGVEVLIEDESTMPADTTDTTEADPSTDETTDTTVAGSVDEDCVEDDDATENSADDATDDSAEGADDDATGDDDSDCDDDESDDDEACDNSGPGNSNDEEGCDDSDDDESDDDEACDNSGPEIGRAHV